MSKRNSPVCQRARTRSYWSGPMAEPPSAYCTQRKDKSLMRPEMPLRKERHFYLIVADPTTNQGAPFLAFFARTGAFSSCPQIVHAPVILHNRATCALASVKTRLP